MAFRREPGADLRGDHRPLHISDEIKGIIGVNMESVAAGAPVWQDCRTLVGTAARRAPPGTIPVNNGIPAKTHVLADPTGRGNLLHYISVTAGTTSITWCR